MDVSKSLQELKERIRKNAWAIPELASPNESPSAVLQLLANLSGEYSPTEAELYSFLEESGVELVRLEAARRFTETGRNPSRLDAIEIVDNCVEFLESVWKNVLRFDGIPLTFPPHRRDLLTIAPLQRDLDISKLRRTLWQGAKRFLHSYGKSREASNTSLADEALGAKEPRPTLDAERDKTQARPVVSQPGHPTEAHSPEGTREERFLRFRKENPKYTLADIQYSAGVHKPNFLQWLKNKLSDSSLMSKRIEALMAGQRPLMKKPKKRSAE